MKQEILDFFDYMTKFAGTKITGVESIPIIYWGETYVTGFKVDDSMNVMVRFKIVKRIDLTAIEGERSDYYMMNPDGDFWLPYEFLDETTIDEVFKEMKDKIMTMTNFDILHMEYKNQKTEELIIEGIIFTNKRLACKETIRYRRNIPHLMYKILHFGATKQKKEEEKTMTTFEFATAALD